MTDLLFRIVEMSLYGSVVILLTLVARLFLKKSSKRLTMILWAAVALRLLLPINIESQISLFNLLPSQAISMNSELEASDEVISPKPDNEIAPVINDVNTTNSETPNLTKAEEVIISNPKEVNLTTVNKDKASTIDYKLALAIVWLVGTIVVLSNCVYSYIKLNRKVADASLIEKNVYVSNTVDSPFVMGIFKPAIYLPDTLSNAEKEYILLHERTHIRHGDWLTKMIGMLAVAIHWFNPLVWIAYSVFEQDIEMSCDEKTVENMDEATKKAYSLSIVSFATKKNPVRYLVTPLAFSKVNLRKSEVTNRVKNILSYKKGSKILATITAVTLIATATACSLNATTKTSDTKDTTTVSETTSETPAASSVETTAASSAETTNAETTEETYRFTSEPMDTEIVGIYKSSVPYFMVVENNGDELKVSNEAIADYMKTKGETEGFTVEETDINDDNYYLSLSKSNDGINHTISLTNMQYDSVEKANEAFDAYIAKYGLSTDQDVTDNSVKSFNVTVQIDKAGSYGNITLVLNGTSIYLFENTFILPQAFGDGQDVSDATLDTATFTDIMDQSGLPYSIVP